MKQDELLRAIEDSRLREEHARLPVTKEAWWLARTKRQWWRCPTCGRDEGMALFLSALNVLMLFWVGVVLIAYYEFKVFGFIVCWLGIGSIYALGLARMAHRNGCRGGS